MWQLLLPGTDRNVGDLSTKCLIAAALSSTKYYSVKRMFLILHNGTFLLKDVTLPLPNVAALTLSQWKT